MCIDLMFLNYQYDIANYFLKLAGCREMALGGVGGVGGVGGAGALGPGMHGGP